MKKRVNFRLIFTILVCFISNNIICQQIIWSYHHTEEVDNYPGNFWVDDKGMSHINILLKDKTSTENYTKYRTGNLIKISNDGLFNSTLFIENCKKGSMFFPFGKKRYLTSGLNCNENKTYSYSSKLYSEKGKLIRTGEPLPTHSRSFYDRTKRITFFSKKISLYDYSYIYIGSLNKRLNIKYDSISSECLKIEGYGMSLGSPEKIGGSTWALSVMYGIPGKKVIQSMRHSHGGLFVVNKKKILWNYTSKKKTYYFSEIESHDDKVIALLMTRNRSKKYCMLFDEYGSLISEFEISLSHKNGFDMKVINKNIVLLTLNFILYYSFDGKLLKKVKLPNMEKVFEMVPSINKSILIVGTCDNRTLLTKIGHEIIK